MLRILLKFYVISTSLTRPKNCTFVFAIHFEVMFNLRQRVCDVKICQFVSINGYLRVVKKHAAMRFQLLKLYDEQQLTLLNG